jgi:hypothetical protein
MIMENNIRPTDDELQEKALYDIIQYLPLDKVKIEDNSSINLIIEDIEKSSYILGESAKEAIKENLPAIKAILKDRPELGKARISNMSWKDNDGDGKRDYDPEGMQACTFERDDQVYISFRGTPKRSWLDNAKGLVKDLDLLDVVVNIYRLVPSMPFPSIVNNAYIKDNIGEIVEVLRGAGEKVSDVLTPANNTSNMANANDVKLNNIFGHELYKYTSPMQEEALNYVESLKHPLNGRKSIFDKYENVYVTGHSKGGNEATLVTMVYSDVIDRCISSDGQGFSPEFIEYMKKTLGEERFKSIQDTQMYGLHGNNDYVNPLGKSAIIEENKIYFDTGIKLEKFFDIFGNHYPITMIDEKTGEIVKITEQGPIGKFIALISKKLMALNETDRQDAALVAMLPLQYLYAKGIQMFDKPTDLVWDSIDIFTSLNNGVSVLSNIISESLMEEEGKEFVYYIVEQLGDDNVWIKDLGKAYDSLDYGDKAPELIEKFISDRVDEIQGWIKGDLNKYLNDCAENINIYMHMRYKMVGYDKYESYGTFDLGTVAINYAKTKELVNILDEMNDLVEGRILPEMEDIADSLRRLSFWKVNVRDWTDIKDSIEKNNNTRKIFKERVINYYNSCEIMEAKFVAGMYGGK